MVVIESKRRKRENILKKYPDAVIADVTGHPCGIGENMGDFVPLSGYHLRCLRVWKANADIAEMGS